MVLLSDLEHKIRNLIRDGSNSFNFGRFEKCLEIYRTGATDILRDVRSIQAASPTRLRNSPQNGRRQGSAGRPGSASSRSPNSTRHKSGVANDNVVPGGSPDESPGRPVSTTRIHHGHDGDSDILGNTHLTTVTNMETGEGGSSVYIPVTANVNSQSNILTENKFNSIAIPLNAISTMKTQAALEFFDSIKVLEERLGTALMDISEPEINYDGVFLGSHKRLSPVKNGSLSPIKTTRTQAWCIRRALDDVLKYLVMMQGCISSTTHLPGGDHHQGTGGIHGHSISDSTGSNGYYGQGPTTGHSTSPQNLMNSVNSGVNSGVSVATLKNGSNAASSAMGGGSSINPPSTTNPGIVLHGGSPGGPNRLVGVSYSQNSSLGRENNANPSVMSREELDNPRNKNMIYDYSGSGHMSPNSGMGSAVPQPTHPPHNSGGPFSGPITGNEGRGFPVNRQDTHHDDYDLCGTATAGQYHPKLILKQQVTDIEDVLGQRINTVKRIPSLNPYGSPLGYNMNTNVHFNKMNHLRKDVISVVHQKRGNKNSMSAELCALDTKNILAIETNGPVIIGHNAGVHNNVGIGLTSEPSANFEGYKHTQGGILLAKRAYSADPAMGRDRSLNINPTFSIPNTDAFNTTMESEITWNAMNVASSGRIQFRPQPTVSNENVGENASYDSKCKSKRPDSSAFMPEMPVYNKLSKPRRDLGRSGSCENNTGDGRMYLSGPAGYRSLQDYKYSMATSNVLQSKTMNTPGMNTVDMTLPNVDMGDTLGLPQSPGKGSPGSRISSNRNSPSSRGKPGFSGLIMGAATTNSNGSNVTTVGMMRKRPHTTGGNVFGTSAATLGNAGKQYTPQSCYIKGYSQSGSSPRRTPHQANNNLSMGGQMFGTGSWNSDAEFPLPHTHSTEDPMRLPNNRAPPQYDEQNRLLLCRQPTNCNYPACTCKCKGVAAYCKHPQNCTEQLPKGCNCRLTVQYGVLEEDETRTKYQSKLIEDNRDGCANPGGIFRQVTGVPKFCMAHSHQTEAANGKLACAYPNCNCTKLMNYKDVTIDIVRMCRTPATCSWPECSCPLMKNWQGS